METERNTATPRRHVLRTTLLVLVLLVAAVSLGAIAKVIWRTSLTLYQSGFFCPIVTERNLAEVEEITGVQFPADTRLLGAQMVVSGPGGGDLLCAMKSSRAQLDTIQNVLPIGEWSPKDRFGVSDNMLRRVPAPHWWHPDAAQDFIAGQTSTEAYAKHGFIAALIDLDDDGYITLYMYRTR